MHEVAIRRLRKYDKSLVVSHFHNLDNDALQSRFGATVNSQAIDSYISGVFGNAALVYGAFPDAHLRGVGELRTLAGDTHTIAEAAFTVEEPWQGQGIGDALLSRLITAAQNRGIREVHMVCLATNQKMRRLAAKHEAELALVPGQIEATLTTPWPTALSMVREITGEYHAFAHAVLRWPGSFTNET